MKSVNTNFSLTFHGQIVVEMALHFLQCLIVVVAHIETEHQLPSGSEHVLHLIFVLENSAVKAVHPSGP